MIDNFLTVKIKFKFSAEKNYYWEFWFVRATNYTSGLFKRRQKRNYIR